MADEAESVSMSEFLVVFEGSFTFVVFGVVFAKIVVLLIKKL